MTQWLTSSINFTINLNRASKRKKKWKSGKVGLYEVESIDNPNIVTVAVNPKEYFEVFRNKKINRKHKGIKKSTQGIEFESYASRIMDLREYDNDYGSPKKLIQKRFQLKKY